MHRGILWVLLMGMMGLPVVSAQGETHDLIYAEYEKPIRFYPGLAQTMAEKRAVALLFSPLVVETSPGKYDSVLGAMELEPGGNTLTVELKSGQKWFGTEVPISVRDLIGTLSFLASGAPDHRARQELFLGELFTSAEGTQFVKERLSQLSVRLQIQGDIRLSRPKIYQIFDSFHLLPSSFDWQGVLKENGAIPGSSAFVLAERDISAKEIYFRKRDDYQDQWGNLKGIRLLILPPDVASNDLSRNAIDLVPEVYPSQAGPFLKGGSFRIETYNPLTFYYLGFNQRAPGIGALLHDGPEKPRQIAPLREALIAKLRVDLNLWHRRSNPIHNKIFRGFGKPLNGPFSEHAGISNQLDKRDEIELFRKAQRAREVFEKWLPIPAGQSTRGTFTLIYPAWSLREQEFFGKIALLLSDCLQKEPYWMKLIVVPVPTKEEWFERTRRGDDFHFFLEQYSYRRDFDISSFAAHDGAENLAGYHDPDLEEMLREYRTNPFGAIRQSILERIHQHLQTYYCGIFLYTPQNIAIISERIDYGGQIHPYRFFLHPQRWSKTVGK